MNAKDLVYNTKRRVFNRYMRLLNRLDPQVATHFLRSHQEFFLAGKVLFETEASHVENAIGKIKEKSESAKG